MIIALTVLSGFIETLQTLNLAADEQERYLALVAQQAQRMQTLVSDLLTLSRLEGSPLPGADEWVDIRGLMSQCVQEARALSLLIGQAGHTLELVVEGDALVAGVPSELHSAIANLVNNAIRYMPHGGTVVLRWRRLPDDGGGEISVTDSGAGIAPEHVFRLTERFYRIDGSRSRETGGTGLGLAIVKHVVLRHGGQLHIHSTLGQGSCFAITLPASRIRSAPARFTA